MLTKDKVEAFMKQHNMLVPGEHILIGFSGGADSVCLFYILQALAKEYKLKLTAVHVEHGIRGQEALEDAEFVEELCIKEGIDCYVEHVSIPTIVKETGLSEEEAGRKVRYECFDQIAKQVGADKIAVAHHKNDVAETMLFHLCRGTGLAGLCALSPVRGKLIRPLLAVDREEIESFLRNENITYRTDRTNEETEYTRNYLRKEVLPLLLRINPKAVEHMAQASMLLEGVKDVVGGVVQEASVKYVEKQDESIFVKKDLFARECEYTVTGVLHNVIEELAGSKKDIHYKHVNSVAQLRDMQVGKKINLPYHLVAEKEYDGVRILKDVTEVVKEDASEEMEIILNIPGQTMLWDGRSVHTRVFSAKDVKDIKNFPDNAYTKWFDYDIIDEYISMRYRRSGDYMVIDAAGGTKKMKDLFINEKIPQKERDRVLLFLNGQQVLWAENVRMGEFGKINSNTEWILEIKIYGGREDE